MTVVVALAVLATVALVAWFFVGRSPADVDAPASRSGDAPERDTFGPADAGAEDQATDGSPG